MHRHQFKRIFDICPVMFQYKHVLLWVRENLSARQFMIFSSVLVGLTAGLAGVVLKWCVHYIHLSIGYGYLKHALHYWYLIFPPIGILLAVLIGKVFFKGKVEKGSAGILFAIIRKSALMRKAEMYSHIVTSGITVGLGGSAGLESPMVVTGSAI